MIKISIITAVYNCKKTIENTINSIINQSHTATESIVIDGLSTDGTIQIIESYRSRLSKFISEHDNGVYEALNKGIKLATGDVIGFLHGDDVFNNDNVLAKIATVFEDASIDAVYGDLVYVHQNDIGRVIRYWQSGKFNEQALSKGWMPPHPTFYVRRTIYEQFGGFDTRYRIAADYDSILRLLKVAKIRIVYIPEIFVRMRMGGVSNRSLGTILQKSREDLAIIRNNKVGGIYTLFQKNFSKLKQFRHYT